MKPTAILALDQGTTSSRAVVFSQSGAVLTLAQQEFRQIFPQPGWVEHDPREIWQTQRAVARQALAQLARVAPDVHVGALAITNQRETTVLWDRATGEPLGNAIVWQDHRTTADCDALRQAGHAPVLQQKTGLLPDPYFSATKIRWLLDHIPGARQKAARGALAFGTIDSWLVWNLTGGKHHVTDVSNASRTLLFDIHRLAWDVDLLALFDIPASLLPRVVPSSGWVADTDAAVLGLRLPISGIAGDQQAATFGQACFAPGMAKNTYGTGCFVLMNTGDRPGQGSGRLLHTVGWQSAAAPASVAYCVEGGVFMGGATVQWLRDGLQIIESAADAEALARQVPDTGDVYLVPAFAGLGAPDWDGHARGTLVGMTRGTGRAHIARAALEAIALQSADVLDAMMAETGVPLRELRVDGGAARNDLLMQMQADYAGVPVVRPRVTETTALGAAFLAGLAQGIWQGADDIAALWQVERRFTPTTTAAARTEKRARWRQAVARARGWAQ